MSLSIVKSLEQLKLDAANADWGAWCQHWDRNPADMHPNDERALLEGCWFDMRAANRVHAFYERYLCLPRKGGGVRPFILFDWWFRDVIGPLFGWKRKDGRRRFSKGFITTAKKSAKSTCLAGLPAYMIAYDGEEEAEAYATAVDRDQAAIVYRKTERMIRHSQLLKNRFTITSGQKRIADEQTGSFFEALSSDADSADGKNWHLLIMDEIHRWRDDSFFNALVYGDISREQPMLLMITTAGESLDGIGYAEYCYARDLLDPAIDVYDLSRFAVICESGYQKNDTGSFLLDENGNRQRREWDDPAGWIEANPSLLEEGTEVKLERLLENANEAKTKPSKKRNFMRFVCNWWVPDFEDAYLSWDSWQRCYGGDPSRGFDVTQPIIGRPCYGGLDLSSHIDITSLCLAFPCGPGYRLKWWFWRPEETVQEAEERDRVPYRDWAQDGWLELIPGRRVEYSYIRRVISGVQLDEQGAALPIKYIDAASRKYSLQGLAYDPWNSPKLINELSEYDGITTVEMRQGFASISKPCKRFQALVLDGMIDHDNNPIAAWMARAAKNDTDPAGNMKLNKKKSRVRIDGIAAAVMAVGLAEQMPQQSGAWSGRPGTGMFG